MSRGKKYRVVNLSKPKEKKVVDKAYKIWQTQSKGTRLSEADSEILRIIEKSGVVLRPHHNDPHTDDDGGSGSGGEGSEDSVDDRSNRHHGHGHGHGGHGGLFEIGGHGRHGHGHHRRVKCRCDKKVLKWAAICLGIILLLVLIAVGTIFMLKKRSDSSGPNVTSCTGQPNASDPIFTGKWCKTCSNNVRNNCKACCNREFPTNQTDKALCEVECPP